MTVGNVFTRPWRGDPAPGVRWRELFNPALIWGKRTARSLRDCDSAMRAWAMAWVIVQGVSNEEVEFFVLEILPPRIASKHLLPGCCQKSAREFHR